MNSGWAVIDGEGCHLRSYSSIFFKKDLVVPQHVVVISVLFIAM